MYSLCDIFISDVCPMFVSFPEIRDVGRDEHVIGVTKLRNEIYVLCLSYPVSVIRVFDDRNSLSHEGNIDLRYIQFAFDIGSSKKDNCLYVSDFDEKCVWKITREAENKYKITIWLTIDYKPMTLSVNSDGQLMLIKVPSSILMIYGSEAELLHSIQLNSGIEVPRHALETSAGNFIILHQCVKRDEELEIGSSGRKWWVISEVTRDGQMVIRRFVPSVQTQSFNNPSYLTLDSNDRVFVADFGNSRVIVLEATLKWSRILCSVKEKDNDEKNRIRCLCFDEENKRLYVGGDRYSRGNLPCLVRRP